MLDWLGVEGDQLHTAFRHVFGDRIRPFGSRSLHTGGLSDGNQGVQWNAGYDPRTGEQWVGVNLEGMQYDGWPIARLIERELRTLKLLDVIKSVSNPDPARVQWTRDYWQATSRPPIVETHIAQTPVRLSRLDEAAWRAALAEALDCLDPARLHRGRATQHVTLAASGRRVAGPVSPHLTVVFPALARVPWLDFLVEAKSRMHPFYDWAAEQAA